MAEITASEIREFLKKVRGEISLNAIRGELGVEKGSKSWEAVRNIMWQLSEGKNRIVKSTGKMNGTYKVINYASAVSVFGVPRERTPEFPLIFPKDKDTGMELPFSDNWVCKQGDLIIDII